MTANNELNRNALGRVICAIRPDWDAPGVKRALDDLANKPFGPLARAFILVACDPTSRTPARVTQNGSWWRDPELTKSPADRKVCRRCHTVHDEDQTNCKHRDPELTKIRAEEARAALAQAPKQWTTGDTE